MAKKLFLAIFLMVSAFVLVSCGGSSKTDLEILIETADAMQIELEVTDNFELPVTFENEDITVSWQSDNAAIFIVSGNQAIVTRGSADVTVKLTATFTLGEAVHVVDVSVVVKAQTSSGSVTVEFTVELPDGTPISDDIFIAGNFGAGSGMPEWAPDNAAGKATRVDATTATFTIVYENISEPVTIVYKWTRGSWDTVEKAVNGDELDNRTEVITSDFSYVTIDNVVERWADINPDMTDAQKLAAAKDALILPADVFEDFTLPLTGQHGATISWESSDSAVVVNGSQAEITRTEDDILVTLTATISVGTLTDAKEFEVSVKSLDTQLYDTFELTIVVQLPSNTPTEDDIYIFGNFPENTGLSEWGGADNPLNKFTRDGNTATITINFIDLTENITLEYKITRGSWDAVEGNETGDFLPNREYVITRLLTTHEIDLIVHTWEDLGVPADTDEAKVEQVINALVVPAEVLEDFTLPLTGQHGTTISWASNNALIIIDGANATILRDEEDVTVELTATVTLGTITETKTFDVIVKSADAMYHETFELTLVVTLPENTPEDDEVFIFGNFPENTGLDAWGGSDNPLNKFNRDGNTATITITFIELTENLNLEFKITRGDWTKVEGDEYGNYRDNRTYEINRLTESFILEITVPTWEDIDLPLTDEQRLDEALASLVISTSVSEDFTLPLTGIHDAVITWESNNGAIVIDGADALVTTGEEDIEVILTATLTVNGVSDIKEFEVTVVTDTIIVYENVTVILTATLPSNTPIDAIISLGGSFGTSSGIPAWNPGSPLAIATREANTATFTIEYTSLEANQNIAYKWTRGSWDNVEKGASGEEIGDRTLTIDRLSPVVNVNDVILNWADLSVDETPPTVVGNLTIIQDFEVPEYGVGITRTIRIWTPTGYNPEGTTTYPVIYMQDGQNLFDAKTSFAGEWEVDETIMRMMNDNSFAGAIVVGIDNAGVNRLNEYTPNWSDKPEASGALYAQFIVETLKPYIDANYLTKPEREYTMVAGSSMGGLISFYIGLEYPEVFGMIGAFSTSFQINTPEARQAFINSLDTESSLPRIIVDAGDGESLQTYVPVVVGELANAGYLMDNVFSEVVSGHGHNEAAWKERLEGALEWLFSTDTGNYVPDVA